MHALTRLLLIAAAFWFWSIPVSAKEIRGMPQELVGSYGENAAACRSGHRVGSENTIFIGSFDIGDDYKDCGRGRQFCRTKVLSHHRIPSGFSLKISYPEDPDKKLFGNEDWWALKETVLVTRNKGNTYRFRFADGKQRILKRCSHKDVMADLGLPAEGSPYYGNKNYTNYYAEATLGICPDLKAIPHPPNSTYGQEAIDLFRLANLDAKRDRKEIPNFRRQVLAAFGDKGRVVSNLLGVEEKIVSPSPKPMKVGQVSPNLPAELVRSKFARNFHRCYPDAQYAFFLTFGEYWYYECEGETCGREVISSRKTSKGYILTAKDNKGVIRHTPITIFNPELIGYGRNQSKLVLCRRY